MHNRAFWRALHSLTHPITISAIVLLIINDHYLKQNYPSWWTGKLSDFAGLVFAPLIFAALLAWLIPPHVHHQEKLVGSIAFIFTGLIFALTKTLPQMNHATTEFWEFFAGGPVKMWLDPTDLLALPALFIGWFIWQGSSNHAMRVALPALTLIAIGSMAATATSCDFPDGGIHCLHNYEGNLYTFAGPIGEYNPIFYSSENGQTWQASQRNSNSISCSPRPPSWEIQHPEQSNLVYQFQSHKSIKVSEDGGNTWKEPIDLSWHTSETRMRALGRSDPRLFNVCNQTVYPGPHDAIFFKETGQLFVAMGLDGLLVLQPNGKWEWVEVGPYHLIGSSAPNMAFFDLWLQFLMGLAAAELTFVFVSQPLIRSCLVIFVASIAWIIWAIMMITIHFTPFAPSAFEGDAGIAFWMMAVFSPMIVGCILYSIPQIRVISASKRKILPPLMLLTVLGFLACFMPFLRWAERENFDAYSSATTKAIWQVLIVQVAGLFFMLFWYRKHKVDVTAASPPSADHPK